jgi:hypothetical protein
MSARKLIPTAACEDAVERLQRIAQSDLSQIPKPICDRFRTIIRAILNQLNSTTYTADHHGEGDSVMVTIGRIYAAVGKIVLDDQQNLLIEVGSPCIDSDAAIAITERLNTDLRAGATVRMLDGSAHVLSSPPSDGDLDAIADAISIRSRGDLVMTHSCPGLDEQHVTADGK